MPQMMPINWLMSFFFFLLMFMIFNIMNYYIYNNISINKKKLFNHKNKYLHWKW
uniref:ATP synthase complex subunit 8 n=1 Tax=Manulea ussurica TaxID=3108273 RepID=A0A6B9MV31_9NEOP|nr:ATP synthase F0 subunit 8 [Brunia dorsalis]QHD26860.1 ATP synthase F0 subunit 8 [Manulea ussurica]UTE83767.1 ATP synthase F0 subunit 8 [Brunia dorsalis]